MEGNEEKDIILPFDPSMRLTHILNICIACHRTVGITKLDYSVSSPIVEWIYFLTPRIPLMCDQCYCFMCDECREIHHPNCLPECNGKYISYYMFSTNDDK